MVTLFPQYQVKSYTQNILTWTCVSNNQAVCCPSLQDKALHTGIGEIHTKWLEQYVRAVVEILSTIKSLIDKPITLVLRGRNRHRDTRHVIRKGTQRDVASICIKSHVIQWRSNLGGTPYSDDKDHNNRNSLPIHLCQSVYTLSQSWLNLLA